MTEKYSIIWKSFNPQSKLGFYLGAEKEFSLPYFIDGSDKENFENGRLNDLQEIHLVRGILVGYTDNPPTVDLDYSKRFFPSILNDLKNHFGFDTTEKLILDIAAFIRSENGDKVSNLALIAGTYLIPESSKIKFDLCVDLYNLIERNEYYNNEIGIKLLKNQLEHITANDINQDFIEHLKIFKEFADHYELSDKEKILKYCQENNRVCPQPQYWNKLWEKLKYKERNSLSGWMPPLPLILAAWWESSDTSKKLRLIEHINWAEDKGQLKEIMEFLHNLKEDDWFHSDE